MREPTWYAAEMQRQASEEACDDPEMWARTCPTCGSTETTELTTEGPPEQSITICAGCGSDEP